MKELFTHVKLALGALLVILLVSLAVLGGYRLYKDYFILDYVLTLLRRNTRILYLIKM